MCRKHYEKEKPLANVLDALQKNAEEILTQLKRGDRLPPPSIMDMPTIGEIEAEHDKVLLLRREARKKTDTTSSSSSTNSAASVLVSLQTVQTEVKSRLFSCRLAG